MFRTLRNFVFGLAFFAAAASVARVVFELLSPEQREKISARVKEAVESGKEAAAARREQLEDRLTELVDSNHN